MTDKKSKTIFVMIAILVIALITLATLYSQLTKSKPATNIQPSIKAYLSPTIVKLENIRIKKIEFKNIVDIPTLEPTKGQGININSSVVTSSKNEIIKLLPYLPYNQMLQVSNSTDVEVLIPPAEMQENPWTLTIHLYGIDFQIPSDNSQYPVMKKTFIDSANYIFQWMESKNVDPKNIIIQWGDKTFIQKRAEEWLE